MPLQGWSKSGADFLSPHAARLTFLQPGRQLVLSIRAGRRRRSGSRWSIQATSATQNTEESPTPGGPAENPASDPVRRVVSSLNVLLDPGGGTLAFPSYHLEVNHLAPVWAGGKLAQKQEILSADVQGKDVHFIDRETAPGGSATTAEAYLIGDQEYDVQNGQVQASRSQPDQPGLDSRGRSTRRSLLVRGRQAQSRPARKSWTVGPPRFTS